MLRLQQRSVGPMPSVASLTDRTPLLLADVAADLAAQVFNSYPSAGVMAVSRPGDRGLGLIERSVVERVVKEGETARPIADLVGDAVLVVNSDCSIEAAVELLLANPDRPDALVVVERGEYVGVCTARALLRALSSGSTSDQHAIVEEVERLFGAIAMAVGDHVQGLLAMTGRLSRQPLSVDSLAHVQSIRAAGETLLRLTNDAGDTLQARQGRLPLNPRLKPLRAVMDEVQARWALRAREVGVALLISYDGDPDLAAVIDSDRLAQVFDNLIDNALRYTRQGSIEASLRARLEADHVSLCGSVRDSGPGGAGAIRTSTGIGGGGADLPLALTQGLLASMKGAVRVEPNPGHGGTILFNLSAPAHEKAEASAGERTSPFSSPHILVVDDNATNRMVAEALCEMFDCTSETAEDGLEAVERLGQGRFDLVLMDIKMPRMDGIAATRAIRALPGPQALTPIVALTANVDPEDARRYLAAGMCCVVEKPIKPERLLQAINAALESAKKSAASIGSDHVAAA